MWRKTDANDLVVNGNGTVTVPHSNSFNSIQFETKINGPKGATIKIGDLEVFIATQGDKKTGSITGHPIKANLVDQNEWCTIEIVQKEGTTVSLNGVQLIAGDAPSMNGSTIQIDVHDAEISLRRIYQLR